MLVPTVQHSTIVVRAANWARRQIDNDTERQCPRIRLWTLHCASHPAKSHGRRNMGAEAAGKIGPVLIPFNLHAATGTEECGGWCAVIGWREE